MDHDTTDAEAAGMGRGGSVWQSYLRLWRLRRAEPAERRGGLRPRPGPVDVHQQHDRAKSRLRGSCGVMWCMLGVETAAACVWFLLACNPISSSFLRKIILSSVVICFYACVCVCVISMELGFYQCNAKRRLCQTWSGLEGGGGTMCGCLDGEEGCWYDQVRHRLPTVRLEKASALFICGGGGKTCFVLAVKCWDEWMSDYNAHVKNV